MQVCAVQTHTTLVYPLHIDNILTRKTDRKDIIFHLQEAQDPETGLSYSVPELISKTVLLISTGLETANTALIATFIFLPIIPIFSHD